MGVVDRLVELDSKVLPARRVRYDTRPPVWFVLSGGILAFLGTAIGQVLVRTDGGVCIAVVAALSAVAAWVLASFCRWHRRHRV